MKKLSYGRLIKRKTSSRYYWHWWDEEKKRNQYKSTGTDDETRAREIAEAWAVQYLAAKQGMYKTPAGDSVITYDAAAIEFLKQHKHHVSKKHFDVMCINFQKHLNPHFSGRKLARIEPRDIQIYAMAKKKDGLKPQTINKHLSQLSQLFKFAALEGWIRTVPYIRRLREQKPQAGMELSDAQIQAIFYAAKSMGDDVHRFVALGYYCALRTSEALRVRWDWIDWDKNLIHFPEQKNRSALPAPMGKARDILLKTPVDEREGNIVQFRDRGGRRRPTKALWKTWRSLLKTAGLDQIRKRDGKSIGFYDLRHSAVTRWVRSFGSYVAAQLARHETQEAQAHYVHVSHEESYNKAGDPL